jgi:S-adenosylmethionine:tRNA ribosyltransferase-isomerase
MLVSDFHYDLPPELIAQHPPAERGSSRMLVLDRATGALTDERFANLPNLLRAGDLLVLNDSRVLPARLYARRGGARTQQNSPQPSGLIEVLLTEQIAAQPPDPAHSGATLWRALVKPARKVQTGESLRFFEVLKKSDSAPRTKGPGPKPTDSICPIHGAEAPRSLRRRDARFLSRSFQEASGEGAEPVLTAEVVAAGAFGERTLRFDPVEDFHGTLARIGHMPLPPYIRRDPSSQADSAEDRARYQTVYSHPPGSAAAPTAGLHFTPQMLAALAARGVEIATLTLHVGLGTFQPVRVERVEEIRLHSERYTLPAATAEALNRAVAEGRRIVAVGTTTTRTLEHIATEAELAGEDRLKAHSGATSIFLAPGHRFRLVGGLLTNFHLPKSTLLMLVAAFAEAAAPERADGGRRAVLAAYTHAIRQGYRFYSYGDCMLLL